MNKTRDHRLEDVMVNLEIISKLTINQKVYRDADNNIGVSGGAWYDRVLRTLTFDHGRNQALKIISEKIENASDIITELSGSIEMGGDENRQKLAQLSDMLQRGITGIEVQKTTYKYDISTVSKFDHQIRCCTNLIERIRAIAGHSKLPVGDGDSAFDQN